MLSTRGAHADADHELAVEQHVAGAEVGGDQIQIGALADLVGLHVDQRARCRAAPNCMPRPNVAKMKLSYVKPDSPLLSKSLFLIIDGIRLSVPFHSNQSVSHSRAMRTPPGSSPRLRRRPRARCTRRRGRRCGPSRAPGPFTRSRLKSFCVSGGRVLCACATAAHQQHAAARSARRECARAA